MTRLIRNTIGVVLCLFFVLPQLNAQQIQYAEYFFDNDPGRGNAISVSITQANTIDASYSISTSSLSSGMHFLYFRVQDTDANWSLSDSRLLYISSTNASDISAAEYFIDNDPGKGAATSVSISAGANIDITESIATSGFSTGIHFLYFRVKNDDGVWSLTDSKLLYISANSSTQDITKAEYFIDTDPGFGNATDVSISAGTTININESINTSSLGTGIHFLHFRVKDANDVWSLTDSRLLYISANSSTQDITKAEYFIDTDPGFGNATDVSISAGATININENIITSSLGAGIHYLYFRVKNADGVWSLTDSRLMYVTESNSSSDIVAAEYFFDNDPGIGNASSLTVAADSAVDISSSVSISALNAGLHNLYVRVKDGNGKWSLAAQQLLYKSESIINGNLISAEYFFDTDPGFGAASSISITPADSINIIATLNTNGLEAGIHKLNIRVKDVNGLWSLNSKRMLYLMAGELSSPRITALEYYFDQDPGLGNGISISLTPNDVIDVTDAIASSSLTMGNHMFYVRAQDSLGRWSLSDKRLVYVSPDMASQVIVAIEYSVDTIMPWGQGTIVNVSSADSLDEIFTFNHGLSDTLYHALYTRVKDAGGRWSMLDSVHFRMENCIIPTAIFYVNNLCLGDSITLYNNSLDIDTATVYEWNIGNNNIVESTDSIEFKIGFAQVGTYDILLKVTNMVCIDTMLKSITVHPRPAKDISSFGDVNFCPGSFSVLSANTGVGYQYQWYKNGSMITNANSSFYQAQDSGSYSAAISNIYNCSDTTAAIDISVYDLPTATVTLMGNNSFCNGDSVVLSANQDAGLTYIWYRNGSIIIGENYSTIAVSNAGDYKVEISNTNGCSDMSSTISISVNPLPTSGISSGGALTFCDGNNVLLYGSNGVGYSYQWYKNDTAISGSTSSFVSALESGEYKVYIENTYQCGDTSSSLTVIVNPSPVSNIQLLGTQAICMGDTAELVAPTMQGLTYQWRSYGTDINGANDSVYYALQTGNYSLITTNGFNCSTESALQLVTVNPNPGASILPLSATTFCSGDSVLLQANTGSNLTYQWFKDNAALVNDTLNGLTAMSSGAYIVEVSNEFSCITTSSVTDVTAFDIPTSIFSVDAEVCSSDTIQIQYMGTATSSAFYNWNFGGATIIGGVGQGPYSVIWNSAGHKSISLTVNENNCSSIEYIDTTMVNSVSASITAPITSVCQGDTVLLTANSGSGLQYQWLQSGNNLSGDTLYSVNITTTGIYQVEVIDASIGCTQKSAPVSVVINATDFSLDFAASTVNFTQPPFDVTFSNSTPNMNEYNFQWELGDGNTSTFYNPIHTYQYNGNYSVAMFAENSTTGCRDTLIKVDYVNCAGGAPNPCNIIAAITPTGPATVCQGDSVLLQASAGTGYTYQWVYNNVIIPNADSIIYYAKLSGNYRVIVADLICSQTSPAFILNNYPSIFPVIQASGLIQPCTTDSLELSLLVNYTNYNWNTGQIDASIYVSQTGYYQVAVTDNYGCNMTSTPYIVSNSYLNPPDLCLIGVDTSNHNQLVWERQSNALIDSFYVYKEGFIAGQYDKIGAVPFNQTSVFVDQNSNPAVKAYKYKIAAVDTCGGVTLLGNFHKTIHLTINAGLNGSWNLIWDGYEGFAFSTYRIYRGTNTNNMSLLTQLPSSATSYTDLNPPTGTVYYQIEIIKTTGCYPDTTVAKVNTNYNSSRSNTANNANINPVYLTADFSADIQTGVWPIQVTFEDASSGGPDAWHWNFGDGNTSVEQNPNHTYNNTGVYTVSLAICNGEICDTIVKTNYIEVLPNGMVEIGVEMSAKLYPNPNDGNFTLEINDRNSHQLEVHIYNTLGAEIYSESFVSNGKTLKHLKLNDLSNGVYFIHLNTKDKVVYRSKFIKQD